MLVLLIYFVLLKYLKYVKYSSKNPKLPEKARAHHEFTLKVLEYIQKIQDGHGIQVEILTLLKNGQYVGPIIEGMLYGVIENPNVEFDFLFNR